MCSFRVKINWTLNIHVIYCTCQMCAIFYYSHVSDVCNFPFFRTCQIYALIVFYCTRQIYAFFYFLSRVKCTHFPKKKIVTCHMYAFFYFLQCQMFAFFLHVSDVCIFLFFCTCQMYAFSIFR